MSEFSQLGLENAPLLALTGMQPSPDRLAQQSATQPLEAHSLPCRTFLAHPGVVAAASLPSWASSFRSQRALIWTCSSWIPVSQCCSQSPHTLGCTASHHRHAARCTRKGHTSRDLDIRPTAAQKKASECPEQHRAPDQLLVESTASASVERDCSRSGHAREQAAHVRQAPHLAERASFSLAAGCSGRSRPFASDSRELPRVVR